MGYSLLPLGFLAASLIDFALATVLFPVTLTWAKGAPDGFERDMIFVNGQMPGPTLNLDQGDDVEFIVTNFLPYSTTIHFHGIEQSNTPWSDGVPGLSQEKIQPGGIFKYKWTATQYGTYWYHGHVQGQLEDGLFGAINIRPAPNTVTPFSQISDSTKDQQQLESAMLNPEMVVLSDWSHFTSEELRSISLAADVNQLCGDSMLINGKGNVNCPGVPFLMSLVPPAQLPLLQGQNLTDKGCIAMTNQAAQTSYPHDFGAVPPDLFEGCKASQPNPYSFNVYPNRGWVSLNLISTASIQEMVFSIDEHPVWVYAIDGYFIEPQLVDALTLQHGSRHSVMVQLNKPAKDYTIRVAGDGFNQKIFVSGILSYINGDHTNTAEPFIDYAGAGTSCNVTFLTDATTVPFPPVKPAQTADQTFKLLLNRTGAAWQWTMDDNMPFNESLEDIKPLLYDPNQLANTDLVLTTKNGTWVDLIYAVTDTGGLQPPHPIHKHSNKASIIGSGMGDFTWETVAEAIQAVPGSFNLDNPPYRDVTYTIQTVSSSTWSVARYQVVNPGPFLLHCHIDPHLTGGMALAILDGIDAWPKVPFEYRLGGNGF